MALFLFEAIRPIRVMDSLLELLLSDLSASDRSIYPSLILNLSSCEFPSAKVRHSLRTFSLLDILRDGL